MIATIWDFGLHPCLDAQFERKIFSNLAGKMTGMPARSYNEQIPPSDKPELSKPEQTFMRTGMHSPVTMLTGFSKRVHWYQ